MTSTLHIRCGSDIREGLVQADIPGDFLEFADPVCQGGTPDGDDATFHEARMAYLVDFLGETPRETDAKLREALDGLERAVDYERIVLWFEHDIYDQAVLIRLLSWFGDKPDLQARLQMIAIDRFPGIERFIGLGQLSPDQIGSLWGSERPVTADQIALAQRAWQAFREANPMALADLIAEGTDALSLLGPALQRHLQELPWTTDGLSLTQRLTLHAIDEGAQTPGQCFRDLHDRFEPQPFLGDIMYWPIVTGLARAPKPAINDVDTWKEPVVLTPFGKSLIEGSADWIAVNGIDRWVGGVHVKPGRVWRWDPVTSRPVLKAA